MFTESKNKKVLSQNFDQEKLNIDQNTENLSIMGWKESLTTKKAYTAFGAVVALAVLAVLVVLTFVFENDH